MEAELASSQAPTLQGGETLPGRCRTRCPEALLLEVGLLPGCGWVTLTGSATSPGHHVSGIALVLTRTVPQATAL